MLYMDRAIGNDLEMISLSVYNEMFNMPLLLHSLQLSRLVSKTTLIMYVPIFMHCPVFFTHNF